ncbi:MAG: metal-dependent hydrolase [Anaerolineales bacterium]
MPSPLAHTVTGVALAYLHPDTPRNPIAARLFWQIVGIMALSNLADLDFLIQLVASRRIHHTFTHSLVFTLAVCTLIAFLIKWIARGRFGTAFSISFLTYGSHVLLDMIGGGAGVLLWWPFSYEAVRAPLQIFPNVNHSEGLIDASHLTFLAFESVYAGAVAILAILGKRIMTAGR